MTAFLVDSNVLLRRLQLSSPHHSAAKRALQTLYRRGDTPHVTAQNLQEFWSVATRRPERGGLGLTTAQTARHVSRIRALFRALPDSPDIYPEWERLVVRLNITDAEVFDARLVAAMNVYSITRILTFNGADFRPFPGITIVDPRTV
jgi:predicted nucleic acid-binding protein